MSSRNRTSVPGLIPLMMAIGLILTCSFVPGASGDTPQTSPCDPADPAVEQLIAGNTAFAFDLFGHLAPAGVNLLFSPYSISLALAMTCAGARGRTEAQIADVLHWNGLGQDRFHTAFAALAAALAGRGGGTGVEEGAAAADRFRLHVSNALWAQRGYRFLAAFLDTLTESYATNVHEADFVDAPEQAREAINRWVREETEGRIEDLLPSGSITPPTRLVLANAVYFSATWKRGFDPDSTYVGPFTLLDGREVTVRMMQLVGRFKCAAEDGYYAIELPYVGDELAMLVLQPDRDRFHEFVATLDAERLGDILDSMTDEVGVHLSMPRFAFASAFNLEAAFADLGMPDAFAPGLADLSGMDGTRELFLADAYHKTYISVDESGTEAGAATAFSIPCALIPVIRLDHPFIFLIRDLETGTILFIGQVMDPTAG